MTINVYKLICHYDTASFIKWRGFVLRGFCPIGVSSQRGFVLGGFVLGGFVLEGFCPTPVSSIVELAIPFPHSRNDVSAWSRCSGSLLPCISLSMNHHYTIPTMSIFLLTMRKLSAQHVKHPRIYLPTVEHPGNKLTWSKTHMSECHAESSMTSKYII